MKRTHRVRDMMAGAVLAALVLSTVSPALAELASKSINVLTGVKVYVNDQIVDPRDANGNPVDVLVYNGTTYLPIRAVGNALNMAVQYDGATQSAYLGSHSSQTPAFYLGDMDYFSGTADSYFHTAATENDNLRLSHSHCITQDFDRTYKLNGQYSRLTANLYQKYYQRADSIGKDGGLWIYGDGRLLYSKVFPEPVTGFEPEAVSVDLTGVSELRVVFDSGYPHNTTNTNGPLSMGEVALYT